MSMEELPSAATPVTAEPEVADAVRAAGGEAVMTDPELPSGTDRAWAAVQAIDPDGRHALIVNLQGDLPTLDPQLVRDCASALARPGVDMTTLAVVIREESERANPNVVKAVVAWPAKVGVSDVEPGTVGRALYFTRATAPAGDGELFHHIGIYGFKRAALERFVGLPPSPLEKREKLEQLRALEAGFRLDVVCVDTLPLGVDTPADLERARALLAAS